MEMVLGKKIRSIFLRLVNLSVESGHKYRIAPAIKVMLGKVMPGHPPAL